MSEKSIIVEELATEDLEPAYGGDTIRKVSKKVLDKIKERGVKKEEEKSKSSCGFISEHAWVSSHPTFKDPLLEPSTLKDPLLESRTEIRFEASTIVLKGKVVNPTIDFLEMRIKYLESMLGLPSLVGSLYQVTEVGDGLYQGGGVQVKVESVKIPNQDRDNNTSQHTLLNNLYLSPCPVVINPQCFDKKLLLSVGFEKK